VVKPRDGSSSVGLRILRTADELDGYLAGFAEAGAGLLAEAYVDGSMFHVDGMVRDGKLAVAWPSQYLYQLAAFGQDSKPRLDVTLDVGDPLGQRLVELVEKVFQALPSPRDTTFHCEVFHTPDDELVLCEVASRNGGALIKSVLETMFGVDFPVAWLRASAGLPIDVPGDGTRMVPRQMAGQLLLLKRPGRVVAAPGRPPFGWIERFEQYVRPGDEVAGATSSGDFMTAMVVSAPDRATCEARLREAAAWFDANLVIEPLPALALTQ
jgi:biotin carboxylase